MLTFSCLLLISVPPMVKNPVLKPYQKLSIIINWHCLGNLFALHQNWLKKGSMGTGNCCHVEGVRRKAELDWLCLYYEMLAYRNTLDGKCETWFQQISGHIHLWKVVCGKVLKLLHFTMNGPVSTQNLKWQCSSRAVCMAFPKLYFYICSIQEMKSDWL